MKKLIKCCGGCIVNLLWTTALIAQPDISRLEYYIDNDPGHGNATSISFTADTNLSNLTVNLDPSSLTSGVHLLGIRAKDVNGAWSQDNKWLFAKPYSPDTKAAAAPVLKQVEYYIDTDPGYGKGVPVAIDSANNLADISLAVNISGLTTGDHNLFVRSKDANNSWSLDNVIAFNTGAVILSPSIAVNSIVRKTLCQNDSVDVSYQATGSYRSDNIFNVELSDATGSFSAPITIGSFTGTGNSIIKCGLPSGLAAGTQYKIRVSSTNPAVTGLPIGDSIAINNPSPVITPPDTIFIRQGDSVKLATTSLYAGYLWSTSDTTSSIQVSEPGSYTVKVTDNNRCSAISSPVLVYVIPVITASGPVSNLCPGTSVTLTSSAANSYLWNTADTTQSITATAAGSYYVVVNGGGTGNISASANVTYKSCGNPGSLSETNITGTAAILNWGKVTCAQYYQLHYRLSGTTKWSVILTANGTSYSLTGLSASTTYQWQVRTVCADNPLVVGRYSSIDSFTTSDAGAIAARAFTAQDASGFTASLYPNPTSRSAALQVMGSKTKISVLITDIAGKILWQRDKINSNTSLPVEGFSAGTYLVIIKDDYHRKTLKLVKN